MLGKKDNNNDPLRSPLEVTFRKNSSFVPGLSFLHNFLDVYLPELNSSFSSNVNLCKVLAVAVLSVVCCSAISCRC